MKRTIAFLLVLILVISLSIPAFADLEDKLGKHWSSKEIDKDFLLYYFSYLARENFKRLNPNEAIREDEFLLSFSSLLKNKGYTAVDLGFNKGIERMKMIKIVGNKLFSLKAINKNNIDLPFTDIDNITDEEREALKFLYALGIIQGQTNSKLNPHANTTQAEAIVVLQRVSDYLDKLKAEEEEAREIPFKLSGTTQTYTGEEGIRTKVEGDKVVVTITKMLPTPGYVVKVNRIVYEEGQYKVYLDITPPNPDAILPQVIVYKVITIEIDKNDLGDAPYNFVWGKIMV